MKRTKLVASLMMCVFCLSFLVVGVFAAVNVSFGLTGQLTFNPEGVYVKVSGQMYRGENYGALEPLNESKYILPAMTNFDEVNGTPAGNFPMNSWEAPDVTLVPGERAVKYRIEVKNVSEAGISGTATPTITGATGTATTTIAGGVKTTVYDNLTVTEYYQYIQNIQPNDTQVYELVIELNENASATTVNVSVAFTFTDSKMYSITWKSNTYNYVNMGSYPQRYVGSTMNEELEEWYTTQTPVGSYTAYKGYTNNSETYTKNTPVVYNAYNYKDGNTYVRIETPDFNSKTDTYMNGEQVTTDGTTVKPAWFKVEPIQWRVLNSSEISNGTANQAVLLSELALSANTTYYYDYSAAANQSTSGYAGYKDSTIREFLTAAKEVDGSGNKVSEGFYYEALTKEGQAKVTARTLEDGVLDPNDVITADTSVTDKVWLPTYEDYNSNYGFTSTTRLCSPSDFAIANCAYLNRSTSYTTPARQNGGTTYYWASSVASYSRYAYLVDYNGSVSNISVNYLDLAARPALLFNL